MIDIENKIFTVVSTAIKAEYPDAYITGEYVRAPVAFPCINIVEQDNYMVSDHMDNSDEEKFAVVMYEITVYSNRTKGKKREARSILSLADRAMYKLNFSRIALTPVPNMEEASIYRLVGRYQAETDGQAIYRR